jgi:serine/threonine protein phosphatase PrpC
MKRILQAHFPVVAGTHPGMKGKVNEDRFAVSAFQQDGLRPVPVLLAVLSDGIGGHLAGEIAAEIAVNRISQQLGDSDGTSPLRMIEAAATQTSKEIYEQAQLDPNHRGMGATLACTWIFGHRLFTANVGDSRIYLLRKNSIRQLSTDHTWIQEALANHLLTPEQVKGHPNAHVIRRYLGSPDPPTADVRMRLTDDENDLQAQSNQGTRLQGGDILLLCSDGLTDLVDDPEILAAFHSHSMQDAIEALTNLANKRGGNDNITLIAIGVPASRSVPVRNLPVNWKTVAAGCLVLVTLLGIIAGVLAGWTWYQHRAKATITPAQTNSMTPFSLFQPSSTLTPPKTSLAPSSTAQLLETQVLLPVESGSTLTPWPTQSDAVTNRSQ